MTESMNNLSASGFGVRITDIEFGLYRDFIYKRAGISLSPLKKTLVENRLSKRLRKLGLNSYLAYYKYVFSAENEDEMQVLVDLLTTNETYFFREDNHFKYLQEKLLPEIDHFGGFKIWSAACSSGEEPYSLAMILADNFGVEGNWQIMATDINEEVLNVARAGKYTLTEKNSIPECYLNNYCLKGVRSQEGVILVDKSLRSHIQFDQLNLMENLPQKIVDLDVVFIRNVMIYFDVETRKRLIDRISERIKIGGYLFISHSETLHKLTDRFKLVQPSIYMKFK